jgi:hypothetical protein
MKLTTRPSDGKQAIIWPTVGTMGASYINIDGYSPLGFLYNQVVYSEETHNRGSGDGSSGQEAFPICIHRLRRCLHQP